MIYRTFLLAAAAAVLLAGPASAGSETAPSDGGLHAVVMTDAS